MKISRTKTGLPALWESGGAGRNTGFAVCVANADGTPKTALFVRHGGDLCNGHHALFVVRPGDLVCEATQERGDFSVTLYRLGAELDDTEMSHDIIAEYSEGEWNVAPPDEAADLINATCHKAEAYHCRSMFYGVEKERRV